MRTFNNFPESLHYVVDGLVDQGHRFIVNVRGPNEVAESKAATIQIVPADFVYDNGALGMTIHMPFDPSSGKFRELVEFLDTQGHDLFDEFRHQGIPCFAINLGRDVGLTTRVLFYMLEKVYKYPDDTEFVCEVYDEGLRRDDDHDA